MALKVNIEFGGTKQVATLGGIAAVVTSYNNLMGGGNDLKPGSNPFSTRPLNPGGGPSDPWVAEFWYKKLDLLESQIQAFNTIWANLATSNGFTRANTIYSPPYEG